MKTKLKNITNYIKKYLKENYISLILLILFACFCFYDTGYSIYKPGGTINSSERVSGTDLYKSQGTFNMAYVGYMKAKLPYYLMAKLISSWELVKNDELTISDNETLNDMLVRDHIEYKSAISNATKVAFDYANIDYQITKTTSYVYYKNPLSKSNIKIGDKLISYDNHQMTSLDELKKYINSKNVNDTIHIKYIEDNKEKTEDTKIYEENNVKYIGLAFININDYSSKYNIKIKSKESESGPSGGLITALAIYNSITKEDITKGKKIVGTGTIDENGKVGEIGSVKFKLAAAEKNNADIFLCPTENYEEVSTYAQKHKLKINVKSVSTFAEAVEYLKTI